MDHDVPARLGLDREHLLQHDLAVVAEGDLAAAGLDRERTGDRGGLDVLRRPLAVDRDIETLARQALDDVDLGVVGRIARGHREPGHRDHSGDQQCDFRPACEHSRLHDQPPGCDLVASASTHPLGRNISPGSRAPPAFRHSVPPDVGVLILGEGCGGMAGAGTRISMLRRAAGLVVVLGFLIVAVVIYQVAPTLPRSSAAEPAPDSRSSAPREDASPLHRGSDAVAPRPVLHPRARRPRSAPHHVPRRVCPTAPAPRCRESC